MAKHCVNAALSIILVLLCFSRAYAVGSKPQTKGLLISPATNFISMNAGTTKSGDLLIANYSPKPINVSIDVEQFNVNERNYSYTFNNTNDKWISLSQDEIKLAPNANKTITYLISIPVSAKPGGNYLTFIASSLLGRSPSEGTAQVTSLLYLTINGDINHSSKLTGYGINSIFFGHQINYHFSVVDTGNIYSFIYESANLKGLSFNSSTTPEAHLIMPGKPRSISGYIEAPVWPGLYTITYGYTITGGVPHKETKTIIYIPPWSIAILLVLLLAINIAHGKRKKLVKNDKKISRS